MKSKAASSLGEDVFKKEIPIETKNLTAVQLEPPNPVTATGTDNKTEMEVKLLNLQPDVVRGLDMQDDYMSK